MESQSNTRSINFITLRKLMRDPTLEPLEKCVLVNLLLYAGVNSKAFPNEQSIGNDLNRSSRHIRTILKRLKESGWLKWKKRGYSKSNQYELIEELYFRNDSINRKPNSVQSGSMLPVQSGTPIPPNISHESNQLKGSQFTDLLQLFRKLNKHKLSQEEIIKFQELCRQYSFPQVKDALNIAADRGKTHINVTYLFMILKDTVKEVIQIGKSRPSFTPCNKNGCENGYIFNSKTGSAYICDCLIEYKKALEEK